MPCPIISPPKKNPNKMAFQSIQAATENFLEDAQNYLPVEYYQNEHHHKW